MTPIVLAELAGSAAYGGGERYLELLFERLDRTRYRGLLICPEPGPFVMRMNERGVETHLVHLAPLFNPIALWRLTQLLARERVTILQTHGARANFYGRIAGRLAGVPVIISTVHNSLKDYEVRSLRRWLYIFLLRLTLPLVHQIICVSDANRRDLIEECPAAEAKTQTVYNGVDPSAFPLQPDCQKVRRELGMIEGPVLVVIARLTEAKGHCYLLQALPCLLDTWPQLSCVCRGRRRPSRPTPSPDIRTCCRTVLPVYRSPRGHRRYPGCCRCCRIAVPVRRVSVRTIGSVGDGLLCGRVASQRCSGIN